MTDLIEPHEPLQDCDCKECAIHERNRLRTVIATALSGRNEAIHAAVAALYFDDSSKFRSALGSVIRHLDPAIAFDVLCHPKAAYDKSLQSLEATGQPE